MLLIVVQLPSAPQTQGHLQQVAALCGLGLADVNQRLAGILPRVLLSDARAERVSELRRGLEALGFLTAACDPAQVPSDKDRIIVRRLEAQPQGLVAIDRAEEQHLCPGGGVRLLQRGVRVRTTSQSHKVSEKKLSLGRAALTGGLMLRKTVERTVTEESESRESFLLVQRGDGEPDLVLYERRLDYRFLGAQMGPASMGNLNATLAWLRQRTAAPLDDRVGQAGFVRGLPQTAADPVDLALHVVTLAHEATLLRARA